LIRFEVESGPKIVVEAAAANAASPAVVFGMVPFEGAKKCSKK
jgi:hypothetical protein